MAEKGIQHFCVPIAALKSPESVIEKESIVEALRVLMDVGNQPLLVHCNKGKVSRLFFSFSVHLHGEIFSVSKKEETCVCSVRGFNSSHTQIHVFPPGFVCPKAQIVRSEGKSLLASLSLHFHPLSYTYLYVPLQHTVHSLLHPPLLSQLYLLLTDIITLQCQSTEQAASSPSTVSSAATGPATRP